jgi:hypothetical protein
MNGTACQRRLDRQGVFGSVKNRMFFPQPPRDGFTGGPENTLSIEASRAQAPLAVRREILLQ